MMDRDSVYILLKSINKGLGLCTVCTRNCLINYGQCGEYLLDWELNTATLERILVESGLKRPSEVP